MNRGLAYDSDDGRALRRGHHGDHDRRGLSPVRAHRPRPRGPFVEYAKNDEPFLRVIGKHRDAAYNIPTTDAVPQDLLDAARETWDDAYDLGRQHGYRNAQVTCSRRPARSRFMMDCDTTGIEPDIALVKYKKLVGEGCSRSSTTRCRAPCTSSATRSGEVEEIVAFIDEHETIEGAPHLRDEHLAVFDCAFKPVNGERSIHYMGHVRMMAAVQPFISGAI